MKPDKLTRRQRENIRFQIWDQDDEREDLVKARRMRGLRRYNLARSIDACARCSHVRIGGRWYNLAGFKICGECLFGDLDRYKPLRWLHDPMMRLIAILAYDFERMTRGIDTYLWANRNREFTDADRLWFARYHEREAYIRSLNKGYRWSPVDPRSDERNRELERVVQERLYR